MSKTVTRLLAMCGVIAAIVAVGVAQAPRQATVSPAPEFVPDTTFRGTALPAAWQQLGAARWTVGANGEIVGTPSSPDGGWLMFDQGYQDVTFFSRVRCDATCDAGVLFRAEKTPTGMQGVFVSLKEGDLNSYVVTLDATGKFVTKDLITNVTWGTIRTGQTQAAAAAAPAGRGGGGGGGNAGGAAAPAPVPAAAGRGNAPAGNAPAAGGNAPAQAAGRAGGGGGGGGAAGGRNAGPGDFRNGINLPMPIAELEPPPYGLGKQPNGDWDQLQIIMDSNIVRPHLNNTNQMAPSIIESDSGYGPIALYVAGTGPVRFRDVSFKDLAVDQVEPERVGSTRFRMQQLEEFWYAWGAAVGDLNRDNNLDVVAGPYYYLGPDFTKRREIYLMEAVVPGRGYAPNMVTHVVDVNKDGWPDVLATESRALVTYINPGNQNRRWQRYAPAVPINGETSALGDIDGDGTPDVVGTYQGSLGYAKINAANPTGVWTVVKVSPQGVGYGHSGGIGDINGDGRNDILGTAGWWENPGAAVAADGMWPYHPVAFGRWGRSQSAGGGEIYAYDVNGDNLNDVVSALHGHGWGLAWFEQRRQNGQISFVRHMIMDNYSTQNAGNVTFSELHGLTVGDVDGDGVKDIITGKRLFSHNDSHFDPDAYGAPVLYWYRTNRNRQAPGGAEFVPELIHNKSGVGSQVAAADLNRDGALDVVTATNRGTFIFFGIRR